MDRKRELEETFEPIVPSNQKMAEDIIRDLAPITQGLQEINRITTSEQVSRQKIGSKRRLVSTYGPLAETFLQKYMDPQHPVDTTFGIRYENGIPMIGNKVIKIEGDDILIDDETYDGTSGLWSLITDKVPKGYDDRDLERYKELLYETNALYQAGVDKCFCCLQAQLLVPASK